MINKKTLTTLYKVGHVLFAIMAIVGLIMLVGFIGNVDHCTELGTESEVGLPHLLGSTLLMAGGVIGYKIISAIERKAFYDQN